jgi:uncharacterized protein (TIGR03084 family)
VGAGEDEGPSELEALRRDLAEEQRSLDAVVADITLEQWSAATPSPGWSVSDQIGHLTFFDASAATAISDPDRFNAELAELIAGASAEGVDEYTLGGFRKLSPDERLSEWRNKRELLAEAAATLRDDARVPWYGPSMSAKSFLTARLMETWAHGVDVVDALGVERPASTRLRHVAQLGYITRGWSYKVRGETPPQGEVRVELSGPSGEVWTFGDPSAQDVVSGPVEEFCLVVTQRRHLDDTSLQTGPLGRHWLVRAQAFAGGPTVGPQPRSA